MKRIFMPVVAAVMLLASCSKSNNGSSNGNAHMNVYLTDGPSTYTAVNVDIQDVQIHTGSDTSDATWQSLHIIKPGVYNLLQFSNGLDTLMASVDIPAGKVSQIRLVLGSNNTVTDADGTHALSTPSAQQSGLKLNLDATLAAGVAYTLWLDFDAGKSIVRQGNGNFLLKPVIRAYTQAESGAVKGFVLPLTAGASVYAIASGNDTVATAIPSPATGYFQVNGLAAGSYSLGIHGSTGLTDTTITNVSVTTGTVTDVGNVQLH